MDNLQDATLTQQAFLNIMSVENLTHELKVETYLKAIAEALGVKFKK